MMLSPNNRSSGEKTSNVDVATLLLPQTATLKFRKHEFHRDTVFHLEENTRYGKGYIYSSDLNHTSMDKANYYSYIFMHDKVFFSLKGRISISVENYMKWQNISDEVFQEYFNSLRSTQQKLLIPFATKHNELLGWYIFETINPKVRATNYATQCRHLYGMKKIETKFAS